MAERLQADPSFAPRYFEALYGPFAFSGRNRIPGMEALGQLRTENGKLFTLLTTQVVREFKQLIVQARALGVSLRDELGIREMGYRALSAIPGLHLNRRSHEEIRTERLRNGLADGEKPSPQLTKFLELFEGSL